MHPTLLAIAGYTLLLSSFVTLLIVMRRGCKWKTKGQFCILSASDVLYSVFTAIILLVNHVQIITSKYYTDENNNNNKTYDNSENNATKEFNMFNYSQRNGDFIDAYCHPRSVLIHYAMLLLPMTNSFISVVFFGLQCNADMKYINKMSNVMTEIQRHSIQGSAKPIDRVNEKKMSNFVKHDLDLPLKLLENIILQITRPRKPDNKISVVYVLSQWLIPVIITSILPFGKYQNFESISESKIDCTFSSNFPLYDCDQCTEAWHFLQALQNIEQSTFDNNYMFNKSINKTPSINSTEVNDIVSSVYAIIQSALSLPHNTTSFYKPVDAEAFDLLLPVANNSQNITKAILHNKDAENVVSITSDNNTQSVADSLATNPHDATHYSDTESWYLSRITEQINSLHATKVRNTTEETITLNQEETTVLYPANTAHTVSRSNDTYTSYNHIHEITTKLPMLPKEQIYADILKRIQTAHKLSIYNSKHKVSRYYDNEYSKQHDYIAGSKNNNIMLINKVNKSHISKDSFKLPLHVSSKYWISTTFLKLYLFMLALFMYLFPIISSIILQIHGNLLYRTILNKIETNIALICACDVISKNNFNKSMCMDRQHEIDPNSVKEPNCNDRRESHYQESTSSDIENYLEVTQEDKEPSEIEQRSDICDKKKLCNAILQETNEIQRIFQMTKISLLLGIFLWTPMFLEVLLKVYLHLHIPTWVIDITFLGAISFGILRNIISLNIINMQDSNKIMNRKENSVYPTL